MKKIIFFICGWVERDTIRWTFQQSYITTQEMLKREKTDSKEREMERRGIYPATLEITGEHEDVQWLILRTLLLQKKKKVETWNETT